jgi:hypothetical protein
VSFFPGDVLSRHAFFGSESPDQPQEHALRREVPKTHDDDNNNEELVDIPSKRGTHINEAIDHHSILRLEHDEEHGGAKENGANRGSHKGTRRCLGARLTHVSHH